MRGLDGQSMAMFDRRRVATRDARTDEDRSPVARRRSHIADLPCCEKIEPYPPLQSDGTMQGRVLVEIDYHDQKGDRSTRAIGRHEADRQRIMAGADWPQVRSRQFHQNLH